MKKNMGNTDRIIRIIVAGVLSLLWFQNIVPGTWGIVLLVLAGVFAVTGFFGFCPLYSLFGITTCPAKKPGSR